MNHHRFHDLLGGARSALHHNVDECLPSGGKRFQIALLVRAQLAGVFNLDAPVGVFDDPDKLQPEHLGVVVFVILGDNSHSRQNFLGDVVVPLTGLAPHPSRHGTVRIKKIAVGGHDAGEYAANGVGWQGAVD